jgi:hypothetical protein
VLFLFSMPSDKDLDAVGLPSTSTIQDLLDNAEDPRQAISEFQEQNALLVIFFFEIIYICSVFSCLH